MTGSPDKEHRLVALRSRVLAAVAAADHYFRLVWTVDHELVEAANTVRPRTWV